MKYLYIFLLPILSFSQQIRKVDFTKANALVSINSDEKKVSGTVIYEFNVNESIDRIKIDAINNREHHEFR